MIRLIHKFCYSHTTLKITKTLQTSKESTNSVDKFHRQEPSPYRKAYKRREIIRAYVISNN